MSDDILTQSRADDCFSQVLASARSADGNRALPDKVFADLDWGRLTEEIAERCVSPDGVELASELGILEGQDVIARRMRESAEIVQLIAEADPPPLRGIRPMLRAVTKARREQVLTSEELRDIARTLDVASQIRSYFARRAEETPCLAQQADRIADLGKLGREIGGKFDPGGDLRDDASSDLGALRRKANSLREGIIRRLERMTKSPKYEVVLQDDFVTMRDGRFVLPVRAGERGDFPGIVHGHSGSGATLFIEPEELIAANNDLRMAQIQVEQEEHRIYRQLSAAVAANADAIELTHDTLVYLDLTCAAGRLAFELEMTVPTLTDCRASGGIDLRRARHPLLALRAKRGEIRKIVANDCRLPDGARLLVVSGPNTGGKTVTLKTIGMFALLVRAGLPVAADEGSSFPIFETIFTDVGDEQAVERDLSTFSGHVENIASFLDDCDAGSLVLLDELFAGTDPIEGGALGRALIATLLDRGVSGVVTTHLEVLKSLAAGDERMLTASVGFDVQRLAPTYRLRLGVPGSSNALDIARRLGLQDEVVKAAEELLDASGDEDSKVFLRRLEAEHERMVEASEAAERDRAKAEGELRKAEELRRRLATKEESALDKNLRALRERVGELEELLREARDAVESFQAPESLEEQERARRRVEEIRADLRDARSGIDDARAEREAARAAARKPLKYEQLAEGLSVWVESFGRVGRIAEVPPKGEKVPIQLGAIRAQIPIDEIYAPEEGEPNGARGVERARELASSIKPAVGSSRDAVDGGADGQRAEVRIESPDASFEVDLRGTRVEEGLDQLERELDRALRAGLPSVRVIHGHGTGALKRAVRSYLPTSPYAIAFRAGGPGEGGDGVTVVEMRLEQ